MYHNHHQLDGFGHIGALGLLKSNLYIYITSTHIQKKTHEPYSLIIQVYTIFKEN